MLEIKTFVSGMVVGAVVVGYLSHYTPTQETKAHLEDTTKSVVQDTVVKHQTKTVKAKDGTVTVVVTDTHANIKADHTSSDKIDVHKVSAPAAKPNYSLGVNWLPSTNRGPQYSDSEVEVAARLGGSDLWLQSGWDLKDHQAKIGLRIEF